MKYMFALLLGLISMSLLANPMTTHEILTLVHQVNLLQNQAMLRQSTQADVDALFALYSADFSYVHHKHGGVYSREHLYRNINKAISHQLFKDAQARYVIESILPGENAAAVRRLEQTGARGPHLSLFEFADGKVKRITEYW